MEESWDSRTKSLIGETNVQKLGSVKVMVLGVGGVGGFVCEALARAGVGEIGIVDKDVVSLSNINRQIIALNSTIGRNKVDVMKERIKDINPNCRVNAMCEFITKDNTEALALEKYNFIVDAIDNVTAKLAVAKFAFDRNLNIISCMGTGNKLEPERFEICDIKKTSVCPLAKVMRKKLKEMGVEDLTVLYSREEPKVKTRTPASISFSPSIAGLRIAEYVIKRLIEI